MVYKSFCCKAGSKTSLNPAVRALPEDVENVLENYHYAETRDDTNISITGKRIVRRGRKVLGLRSNLVKTNYLDHIHGVVRTAKATVVFSAADAEWDADPRHPLILKKEVTLTIDGKPVPAQNGARIHFQPGVIEAGSGQQRKTFHFQ